MRKLTDHKIGEANEKLAVCVMDEPTVCGACHHYSIEGFDAHSNASLPGSGISALPVLFQNGVLTEVGINGSTNEAYLAILIDRMRGFQNGPFKCRENALALTYLEEALMWLQKRTRDRLARGVEGTHKV